MSQGTDNIRFLSALESPIIQPLGLGLPDELAARRQEKAEAQQQLVAWRDYFVKKIGIPIPDPEGDFVEQVGDFFKDHLNELHASHIEVPLEGEK